MESQKSDYDLGKENYYCGNILYGYDDKYAYAWVSCQGFIFENGELEGGSGFSVPVRLEYKGQDFQIVNFKEPSDGSYYRASFIKLFPEKLQMNPSRLELEGLIEEVRIKAESSI
ncbi:MAG: hypothetical protein V1905_02645 [bacterium]